MQKWLLLILSVMYLPLAVSAQPFVGKDGKYIRKGCKVVVSEPRHDTMMIVDPVNGEEVMKERLVAMGLDSINGKRVYNANEVTNEPQSYPGKPSLEKYLITKLKKDIEALQLPDGEINIDLHRIVIDENGIVVYYELGSVYHRGSVVNEKLAPKINRLIGAAPAMVPGALNRINVVVETNPNSLHDFKATIKNHVVTYKND